MRFLIVICVLLAAGNAQKEPNTWPGRTAMVHLFEWKFGDIADECENFLAPQGYAGVQVSPVNEYAVITDPPNNIFRPWWERYQPVSYIVHSRSGDEAAFLDMTTRCNAVGVRIYVDVVLNHMTGKITGVGTAGSSYNGIEKLYPAVPYNSSHFHVSCPINDYNDPYEVRYCELVELNDLDQFYQPPYDQHVPGKLVDFMNKLVALGVAGFRIDAAKHMWPTDLRPMYEKLNDLNTAFGFANGARPFIFQEVSDLRDGSEGVSIYEYTDFGRVTDFKYGLELSNCFLGKTPLKWLFNFGPGGEGVGWGLVPGPDSLVFIDNHDSQRDHDGAGDLLTFKIAKEYKMAVAFMLSWPHGFPRVMSSFAFTDKDEGPPADGDYNILGPDVQPDGTCGNGWVCEHRWRQIFNMVGFGNAVAGTGVNNWWVPDPPDSQKDNHIAYCRGNAGFIAFNGGGPDFIENIQTCLPPGTYCDVISGSLWDGSCTGKSVTVTATGVANIVILTGEEDGVLAIHLGSKARDAQRAPGGN